MDIPRIFCMGLLIFLLGRVRYKELLPNTTGMKLAAGVGLVLMIPIFFRALYFEMQSYPLHILGTAIVSSFAVGFFEEMLFRGGIFGSLNEWLGAKKAVFYSSLLFMVFHIQAQSLSEFPYVFALGVAFAFMRRDGVSLFGLAILHSFFDCLVLFWTPDEGAEYRWRLAETIFYVFVVLVYWRLGPKRRPELVRSVVS